MANFGYVSLEIDKMHFLSGMRNFSVFSQWKVPSMKFCNLYDCNFAKCLVIFRDVLISQILFPDILQTWCYMKILSYTT